MYTALQPLGLFIALDVLPLMYLSVKHISSAWKFSMEMVQYNNPIFT